MPTKALPSITAWSFSRLKDYLKCAYYACLKHVQKMKEPGSAAMDEGSRVHKIAEHYSTKQINGKIPVELELFKEEFSELRKYAKTLHVEQDLALDVNWKPTGWFDKTAWVRIKMDCFYDVGERRIVIDYKNGKVRVEDQEQLDLYAIGAFAYAPASIEVVDAQLWYLTAGELVAKTYTRKEAEALKKVWLGKTKQMLTDRTFKPTPGKQCGWCHFRKANGGPCKH